MTPFEEWLQDRPDIIKQLAAQCPPDKPYRIKATGQIATLYSYHENGTMTVITTNELDIIYKVFDLKPEDIEQIHDT